MLDFGHIPNDTRCDIQFFRGNCQSVASQWHTWNRPRGTAMTQFILVGAGGGGGNSVVGAASTAAGGGGGASGCVHIVTVFNRLLPETLFLSIAGPTPNRSVTSVGTNFGSYISTAILQGIAPTAWDTLVFANSGNSAGASTGATAGPAGTAGTTTAITNALLSGQGIFSTFLAGQVGIIGGTTVSGAALTLPTTGIWCTGAPGGGGLPAISTAGSLGGLITGIANTRFFPANIIGGIGGTITPTAGGNGISSPPNGLWKNMIVTVGGTGGGSSGMSGSSGLAGGLGGTGGLGSGGGGGGGGFTGAIAANGGYGGAGYCIAISW